MSGLIIGKDICLEALAEKLRHAPNFMCFKTDFTKLADALNLDRRYTVALRQDVCHGKKSYEDVVYDVIKQWMESHTQTPTLAIFCKALEEMKYKCISDYLKNVFIKRRPSVEHQSSLNREFWTQCGTNGKLKYNPNEILGEGSYNTIVYSGLLDSRRVAIKHILCKPKEEERISSELNALLDCDGHENVVRYYCHEVVKGNFHEVFFALELCEATLMQWVKGLYPADIEPVDVLHQITKGLDHLHKNRIVHRDIQPNNILLVPLSRTETRVKISDFGISRRLPYDRTSITLRTNSGTEGWTAPEILTREDCEARSFMSLQSDIFSLGCIFYYVLSKGFHPFGTSQVLLQANIVRNEHEFAKNKLEDRYLGYLRLIMMMTAEVPGRRPTASAILHHHIFWKPAKNLQFIVDVSNSLESIKENCPLGDCMQQLENCPIMSRYCLEVPNNPDFGGWIQFPCKIVQTHIAMFNLNSVKSKSREKRDNRKVPYHPSYVCDLLRFIRNMLNHYSTQPDSIREALGAPPDKFLEYWLTRYPFLIDSVFMAFEAGSLKCESILEKYYDKSFQFSNVNISSEQVLKNLVSKRLAKLFLMK